jgi:hypothetical protein
MGIIKTVHFSTITLSYTDSQIMLYEYTSPERYSNSQR